MNRDQARRLYDLQAKEYDDQTRPRGGIDWVLLVAWTVILGVSVLILVGSVMLTVAVVRRFWS
jgi:hypothetical protein